MSNSSVLCDRLMNEFAENYMEKIFYFCLKKTGDQYEAEDLTQDIALQIITSLQGGTIPTSFSAWVWQIARNRYSLWAARKHNKNESVTGSDIGDYEIEDESENLLGETIHAEEMSLLRRELAFIKSDYRNIVIAYYIENKSVREIASALSLPENTVKSRLFRAREILKEGMDMAREFGVRSYKPEEVDFTCSCKSFGDKGQPWNVLSHKIYNNIFLEAYGNPSTAEELSLELGIALPYMEDELDYLTKQTMLIKNADRYETAFPIVSKDAQEKVWNYNCRVISSLTELFTKLIDDFTVACNAHGIDYFGKYQSYEDAKWVLLMRAFDKLMYSASPDKEFAYTKRPDHGQWDIVGFQSSNIPYIPWVGLHGCPQERKDKPAVHFQQFKYRYKDIMGNTPDYLSHDEALTLKSVAEGKSGECEEYYLGRLADYGYIAKTDSGYEPTIIIFDGKSSEEYLAEFTDSEKNSITNTVAEIRRILKEVSEFAYKTTAEDLPAAIASKENMCVLACRDNAFDRCYILNQALNNGWLKYDEHTSRVIGAYMYL